jgi:hypothetical protein
LSYLYNIYLNPENPTHPPTPLSFNEIEEVELRKFTDLIPPSFSFKERGVGG